MQSTDCNHVSVGCGPAWNKVQPMILFSKEVTSEVKKKPYMYTIIAGRKILIEGRAD